MHRIDQTEGSDRTALSKVDHRDSRRRTEFPFGLNALRLKVGFRALEPSTRCWQFKVSTWRITPC
jgi:hypothetical protein